jgi:D-aspartate ligase
MEPPAVVVSSGVQGLAVTRGLGERGVPVVVLHWTDNDLAAASRYAVEAVRIPQPEAEGPAFVDRLLGLADRHSGAVVIPTADEAVKDIAMRKRELERHYIVACPEWEIACRFIDKRYTYELAAEVGVSAPATWVPEGTRDLERIDDLVAYPCLVKPRQSHLYAPVFKEKVTVVRTLDELRAAYKAAAEAGLEVLVQEIIPGPDSYGVNYNAYRANGEVWADCTARKLRLSPPRFGVPMVVCSAAVPEVVQPGRAMLAALGIEGFTCTEFKFDPRDGVYKLLEVNGRHNFSAMLAIRCGLNFPWISYRHLTTGKPPERMRTTTGVYWIHESSSVATAVSWNGDAEGYSLRELVRTWSRPHVLAVYDRNDSRPFRKGIAGFARRAASRALNLDR